MFCNGYWKNKFQNKMTVDLSLYLHIRNCAIIKYNDMLIAVVHLEIGDRFHHLPITSSKRKQIEKNNTEVRIRQLDLLLTSYPKIDIIVGDFNFMPNNHEFKWLLDKGFEYAKDYEWTTPYNRVDMVFIKKTSKINVPKDNITIKCDYSDHYPILSRFS